jgi:aminotransferase EvaB
MMAVRYSYLPQQFQDCEDLWESLKEFVKTGDFTLGQPLQQFERGFADLIGTRNAIGVNSGTDAIKLSLRALGVKPGDEVITAANTFVATVGAIAEVGAIPVFVDADETFCIDISLIESAITEKTSAIVPVHFSGYMAKMDSVLEIADRNKLVVVEDACQSILAEYNNKKAGTWANSGAFSLHPLKNINVWSDGGVITTNDDKLAENLRLIRNHGLVDRDTVECLGFNSRLDTFQAVVGNWLLPQANSIALKRIENAEYLDANLSKISQVKIPERPDNQKVVFHLYMFYAERRDELLQHMISLGIEAKVHYPIPIYKQKALSHNSSSKGSFPVSDNQAKNLISLPCDQHLTRAELDEMIHAVRTFYISNR